MKNAQRSVFVFVLLPALAVCAGCADSPMAPSHPALGAPAAQGPSGGDAASFASAAADPLLLTAAAAQQASCTVEVVKTSVFDPDKGKEGDWVAYDGSVVEVVPPEDLFFKYDLKVDIPAKHYVNFLIGRSVLQPGTPAAFQRPKWKPPTIDGQFAGNKSVQLDLSIQKTVSIGNDNKFPVLANTFEITPNWTCRTGFDEVSSGTLGTFKFKGVEKKKKK